MLTIVKKWWDKPALAHIIETTGSEWPPKGGARDSIEIWSTRGEVIKENAIIYLVLFAIPLCNPLSIALYVSGLAELIR